MLCNIDQFAVEQCEDFKVKYNEEQMKRRKLYNQVQETKGSQPFFIQFDKSLNVFNHGLALNIRKYSGILSLPSAKQVRGLIWVCISCGV